MRGLMFLVIGCALIVGGWLLFDGVHALVRGDYVTPRSGRFAGQLGPWSRVVAAVGLAPRSTTVKVIHVIVGAAALGAVIAWCCGADWAWTALLVCALGTLWYLPFGTVLGLVQIVILMLPAIRAAAR